MLRNLAFQYKTQIPRLFHLQVATDTIHILGVCRHASVFALHLFMQLRNEATF